MRPAEEHWNRAKLPKMQFLKFLTRLGLLSENMRKVISFYHFSSYPRSKLYERPSSPDSQVGVSLGS